MLSQTKQRIRINNLYKIPACSGQTIAQAEDVFSWVDPRYETPEFNIPQESTKENLCFSLSLPRDMSVKDGFSFKGIDPERLCFTQSQIINICELYPHLFPAGESFLLFKEKQEIWVANISTSSGKKGLFAYLVTFTNNGLIASGKIRNNIVLPKTEILNTFFQF